jgi:curved DNA-binding protein
MASRDLYAVLGVPKGADEDTIKKAYRKLAMKLHPDRAPGKANEQKFKEVNQANDVLSDPKRRALYDEFGEESLSQNFDADRARLIRQYQQQPAGAPRGGVGAPRGGVGFDPQEAFGGGADFGDMFGDLFGRTRGAGGASRKRRGQDLEATVTIDFVSAVKGTTLELKLHGAQSDAISVRVPPGANEGSRLRIPGQGGPGVGGGPQGDMLLEIHVEAHPYFTREGDDLRLDVPITPGEAYRGGKIRIPTPDGDVSLKVPEHAQSGQITRLRGKGVTRKGKTPGDLYVRFLIQMPKTSDPEIERAIEVIEKHVPEPRGELKF